MVTGPDAPLRRFLGREFGLDGWRIDVANMTGRYGSNDRNREVFRAVRRMVAEVHPGAYLVGEHFHDYLADLDGSGWQGVMNYAGFTKPLWSWLAHEDLPLNDWMGVPGVGWPRLPATSMVASMQNLLCCRLAAPHSQHEPGLQSRHASDSVDHRRSRPRRGSRGGNVHLARGADGVVRR